MARGGGRVNFGGRTEFQMVNLGNRWTCTPETQVWLQKSDSGDPARRAMLRFRESGCVRMKNGNRPCGGPSRRHARGGRSCERDARFDDAFIYAVASTGIYCRPLLPSAAPAARASAILLVGCIGRAQGLSAVPAVPPGNERARPGGCDCGAPLPHDRIANGRTAAAFRAGGCGRNARVSRATPIPTDHRGDAARIRRGHPASPSQDAPAERRERDELTL